MVELSEGNCLAVARSLYSSDTRTIAGGFANGTSENLEAEDIHHAQFVFSHYRVKVNKIPSKMGFDDVKLPIPYVLSENRL